MDPLSTLAKLLDHHAKTEGANQFQVRGLTLFRHSGPTPPCEFVYEPSICLIAQGAKRVELGETEYRYDAGMYLLVSADLPAKAFIVGATARVPYLALTLLLDPLEVGEFVAQLDLVEPRPAERALDVSSLDPALLDSVTRLVRLLERPQDAMALAPLVRKEITYRLLVGPQGARLKQMVTGPGPGQRVTDVVRWMKAHFAEPLHVEALAKRAGMSSSALHRHFKAVTSMSPLQYQKRLRLQEARRLMLGESLDAAEAGFKVGYDSPSQFSREYRRLFGAPPRKDVDAIRAA
ncbi:MAG: AraC family transcriptional regulator [Myxococcales bacterium]